jgi:5'-nucleotidase
LNKYVWQQDLSMNDRIQILLTNDDGILSPGLWAAAAALSEIGYVTIAAPREQVSAAGRSLPRTYDGRIERTTLTIGGQEWPVFAVGGTPAQAVQHAILEIMPTQPDLVVAGINYGENVGLSITASGTVGAAIEGATIGIPSLAVSLQIFSTDYLTYHDLDFTPAAFFTQLFARMLLHNHQQSNFSPDIDLLKIEVPADATSKTPWRITRLARHRYYIPTPKRPVAWDQPYYIDGAPQVAREEVPEDSDVYALLFDKVVAVTPISLDMTSRVDLNQLEQSLRA